MVEDNDWNVISFIFFVGIQYTNIKCPVFFIRDCCQGAHHRGSAQGPPKTLLRHCAEALLTFYIDFYCMHVMFTVVHAA